MTEKLHSAEHFGDSRDFWWNRDFLQLMASRLKLPSVRNALDVGCGVGHWSRCVASLLSPESSLIGVDREPRWVGEASVRSRAVPDVAMSFQQAEAERLPFPDGTFDLVTCQTLLIHVSDPLAVLREMLRVLTVDGRLVIVEPSNITGSLGGFELQRPLSELIGLLEFQMLCEHGKKNLGEGFNSAGPLVAGWLSDIGVEEIESFLSDKTTMLVPPYASADEQAFIRDANLMRERDFWLWDKDDTRRYFLAGGGKPETFDAR